jgi:hypothetical protein
LVEGGQGWSGGIKSGQEWSRVVKSGKGWSRVVKGDQAEGDNSFLSRVSENTVNHTGEFSVHSVTSDLCLSVPTELPAGLFHCCPAPLISCPSFWPADGKQKGLSTNSARLLPNYKFLTWSVCNAMAV